MGGQQATQFHVVPVPYLSNLGGGGRGPAELEQRQPPQQVLDMPAEIEVNQHATTNARHSQPELHTPLQQALGTSDGHGTQKQFVTRQISLNQPRSLPQEPLQLPKERVSVSSFPTIEAAKENLGADMKLDPKKFRKELDDVEWREEIVFPRSGRHSVSWNPRGFVEDQRIERARNNRYVYAEFRETPDDDELPSGVLKAPPRVKKLDSQPEKSPRIIPLRPVPQTPALRTSKSQFSNESPISTNGGVTPQPDQPPRGYPQQPFRVAEEEQLRSLYGYVERPQHARPLEPTLQEEDKLAYARGIAVRTLPKPRTSHFEGDEVRPDTFVDHNGRFRNKAALGSRPADVPNTSTSTTGHHRSPHHAELLSHHYHHQQQQQHHHHDRNEYSREPIYGQQQDHRLQRPDPSELFEGAGVEYVGPGDEGASGLPYNTGDPTHHRGGSSISSSSSGKRRDGGVTRHHVDLQYDTSGRKQTPPPRSHSQHTTNVRYENDEERNLDVESHQHLLKGRHRLEQQQQQLQQQHDGAPYTTTAVDTPTGLHDPSVVYRDHQRIPPPPRMFTSAVRSHGASKTELRGGGGGGAGGIRTTRPGPSDPDDDVHDDHEDAGNNDQVQGDRRRYNHHDRGDRRVHNRGPNEEKSRHYYNLPHHHHPHHGDDGDDSDDHGDRAAGERREANLQHDSDDDQPQRHQRRKQYQPKHHDEGDEEALVRANFERHSHKQRQKQRKQLRLADDHDVREAFDQPSPHDDDDDDDDGGRGGVKFAKSSDEFDRSYDDHNDSGNDAGSRTARHSAPDHARRAHSYDTVHRNEDRTRSRTKEHRPDFDSALLYSSGRGPISYERFSNEEVEDGDGDDDDKATTTTKGRSSSSSSSTKRRASEKTRKRRPPPARKGDAQRDSRKRLTSSKDNDSIDENDGTPQRRFNIQFEDNPNEEFSFRKGDRGGKWDEADGESTSHLGDESAEADETHESSERSFLSSPLIRALSLSNAVMGGADGEGRGAKLNIRLG